MGLLFYLVAYWVLSGAYHSWLSPTSQRRRRRLKLVAKQLRDRLKWERDELSDGQIVWRKARLSEAQALRKQPEEVEAAEVLMMRLRASEIAAQELPPSDRTGTRAFEKSAKETAQGLMGESAAKAVKQFVLEYEVRQAQMSAPLPSMGSSKARLLKRLLEVPGEAESRVMGGAVSWQEALMLDRVAKRVRTAMGGECGVLADEIGELLASEAMALSGESETWAKEQREAAANAKDSGRMAMVLAVLQLEVRRFWFGTVMGPEGVRVTEKMVDEGRKVLAAKTVNAEAVAQWQERLPLVNRLVMYHMRLHWWSGGATPKEGKWLGKQLADLEQVMMTGDAPSEAFEKKLLGVADSAGKETDGKAAAAGGLPDWVPMVAALAAMFFVNKGTGSRSLGLMVAALVYAVGWAYQAQMKGDLQTRVMRWMKRGVPEIVELVIVVFGVVAGLRGMFVQPFKIPTGSMQPTLYGIHFKDREESGVPGKVQRALDYVNFSRRYVDAEIVQQGVLEREGIRQGANPLMLFPNIQVAIGEVTYKLPGALRNVYQYVNGDANRDGVYEVGEVLARGFLLMGDHLFVDRVSYNFTDPKRGDIAVFVTDGITTADGDPLAGRYYIKRLVGLPGDTLRITDHRLYVMEDGAEDFRLVDGDDSPAFERMYSFKGGYKGYSHAGPQAQYLTHDESVFLLGENEYFMMGDNSENSQDSRYWGTVPRSHLVGRACFVWWPFSRRWGPVDKAEPEEYVTLPTRP